MMEQDFTRGVHGIPSGNPKNRPQLIAAGLFVLVWFSMDAIEWADWLHEKLSPHAQQSCVSPLMMAPIPGDTRLPNGSGCSNGVCPQ